MKNGNDDLADNLDDCIALVATDNEIAPTQYLKLESMNEAYVRSARWLKQDVTWESRILWLAPGQSQCPPSNWAILKLSCRTIFQHHTKNFFLTLSLGQFRECSAFGNASTYRIASCLGWSSRHLDQHERGFLYDRNGTRRGAAVLPLSKVMMMMMMRETATPKFPSLVVLVVASRSRT